MMTIVHVCMHAYTPMMQHYLSLFLSVLSLSLSLLCVCHNGLSFSFIFPNVHFSWASPNEVSACFPGPRVSERNETGPNIICRHCGTSCATKCWPCRPRHRFFPGRWNRKGWEGEDKNTIVGILSGCVGDARIQNVHV